MMITDYLFGKFADRVIEHFQDIDKKDFKNLVQSIDDFKNSVLEQHKENPDFEQVEEFWKQHKVVDELVNIRYSLNSPYKTYEDYREQLSELFISGNRRLCFNLLDELNNRLIVIVRKNSNLSNSDIAVIDERLHKMSSNILSNITPSFTDKGQILKNINMNLSDSTVIDKQPFNKEKIILLVTGGFENGTRTNYEIGNFVSSRDNIAKLILSKDSADLILENRCSYKQESEKLKEYFQTLKDTDTDYLMFENAVMDSERRLLGIENHIDKVSRALKLYFSSNISNYGVITTPTDLKNLIESMLNRTAIRTDYKKYQFFVNRTDDIYFNVYLSREEIDYINNIDNKILDYAKLGGDPVLIDCFKKETQIKIVSELLLELVDRENVSKKYYRIGNYLIAKG